MQKVRLVSTKNPRQTKDVAPRYVATLIKLGLYRYPDAPAVATSERPDKPSMTSKAMAAEDAKGGSHKKRKYKRRDMRAEE